MESGSITRIETIREILPRVIHEVLVESGVLMQEVSEDAIEHNNKIMAIIKSSENSVLETITTITSDPSLKDKIKERALKERSNQKMKLRKQEYMMKKIAKLQHDNIERIHENIRKLPFDLKFDETILPCEEKDNTKEQTMGFEESFEFDSVIDRKMKMEQTLKEVDKIDNNKKETLLENIEEEKEDSDEVIKIETKKINDVTEMKSEATHEHLVLIKKKTVSRSSSVVMKNSLIKVPSSVCSSIRSSMNIIENKLTTNDIQRNEEEQQTVTTNLKAVIKKDLSSFDNCSSFDDNEEKEKGNEKMKVNNINNGEKPEESLPQAENKEVKSSCIIYKEPAYEIAYKNSMYKKRETLMMESPKTSIEEIMNLTPEAPLLKEDTINQILKNKNQLTKPESSVNSASIDSNSRDINRQNIIQEKIRAVSRNKNSLSSPKSGLSSSVRSLGHSMSASFSSLSFREQKQKSFTDNRLTSSGKSNDEITVDENILNKEQLTKSEEINAQLRLEDLENTTSLVIQDGEVEKLMQNINKDDNKNIKMTVDVEIQTDFPFENNNSDCNVSGSTCKNNKNNDDSDLESISTNKEKVEKTEVKEKVDEIQQNDCSSMIYYQQSIKNSELSVSSSITVFSLPQSSDNLVSTVIPSHNETEYGIQVASNETKDYFKYNHIAVVYDPVLKSVRFALSTDSGCCLISVPQTLLYGYRKEGNEEIENIEEKKFSVDDVQQPVFVQRVLQNCMCKTCWMNMIEEKNDKNKTNNIASTEEKIVSGPFEPSYILVTSDKEGRFRLWREIFDKPPTTEELLNKIDTYMLEEMKLTDQIRYFKEFLKKNISSDSDTCGSTIRQGCTLAQLQNKLQLLIKERRLYQLRYSIMSGNNHRLNELQTVADHCMIDNPLNTVNIRISENMTSITDVAQILYSFTDDDANEVVQFDLVAVSSKEEIKLLNAKKTRLFATFSLNNLILSYDINFKRISMPEIVRMVPVNNNSNIIILSKQFGATKWYPFETLLTGTYRQQHDNKNENNDKRFVNNVMAINMSIKHPQIDINYGSLSSISTDSNNKEESIDKEKDETYVEDKKKSVNDILIAAMDNFHNEKCKEISKSLLISNPLYDFSTILEVDNELDLKSERVILTLERKLNEDGTPYIEDNDSNIGKAFILWNTYNNEIEDHVIISNINESILETKIYPLKNESAYAIIIVTENGLYTITLNKGSYKSMINGKEEIKRTYFFSQEETNAKVITKFSQKIIDVSIIYNTVFLLSPNDITVITLNQIDIGKN